MSTVSRQSSWNRTRVLVTGATGLLGSHLTRFLHNAGAEVVALVRDGVPKSLFYSPTEEWDLANKITIVRGSIEDFRVLERIVNEYEIQTVFHLAAQTIVGTANQGPLPTLEANIMGTANVLEACRLHKKYVQSVVIASSDKAYGNLHGESYNEDFPLKGSHPYDVSKSCADLVSQMYFKSFGLPVAITRCGNFFGAGDLNISRLVPGTIRDVLENKAPVIRSDGKFIRDYLYVEDGVHAYVTLAEAITGGKFGGEAFNFSYGLRLTVFEMVNKILQMMNREDLKPIIKNEASNEIPVQCLDSTKAREQLQWKPLLGFEQGMSKTIDWYRTLQRH